MYWGRGTLQGVDESSKHLFHPSDTVGYPLWFVDPHPEALGQGLPHTRNVYSNVNTTRASPRARIGAANGSNVWTAHTHTPSENHPKPTTQVIAGPILALI